MPPGLWLAQTASRQILHPPIETGSHVDRDRFAFVAAALLPATVTPESHERPITTSQRPQCSLENTMSHDGVPHHHL